MAERLVDELTSFDETMIHYRTAVVVRLIETGRIDPLIGVDIIEAQKHLDIIREERDAYASIANGGPNDDSPFYRLATQLVKLRPQGPID